MEKFLNETELMELQ